jgi:hypothetical protein
LQWLTAAQRRGDFGVVWLRVSWALDPIRTELQLKAIEARLNFPP